MFRLWRISQHERFGVLTLVNTTGADTGEYTCYPMYCEDTDCRKEYDKAAKVFVFFPGTMNKLYWCLHIHFSHSPFTLSYHLSTHILSLYETDPQELFVPSSDYYEVIQLRTNWPTVLPCQVTSPEARVTLHREFPPVEVAVDGTDISFDVKKGFTIHRPRPHHAGALYCVASLGNLRQSSTKYMLIYVNCECCHLFWIRLSSDSAKLSQHASHGKANKHNSNKCFNIEALMSLQVT